MVQTDAMIREIDGTLTSRMVKTNCNLLAPVVAVETNQHRRRKP
jgi:hypothetical protein